MTGRVPLAGLHRDEERRATLVLRLAGIPERLLASDALCPVLGSLVGREAGSAVPAIVGLPADTSEDRMKALGAAAASSGSVATVHVVGEGVAGYATAVDRLIDVIAGQAEG